MRTLKPRRHLRVRLRVNGREVKREVEARKSLADFLREDLRLTGTHVGCEQGVCGACTVLVEGAPVRSCLMLAVQAEGFSVETVEGLAPPEGPLHPIQDAFHRHHALQCGFCTPGILMTLKAALSEGRERSREEIRELLSGNVCRCTGYHHIVDAVEDAARLLRQGAEVGR
ncbi:MAG: (2Fe-2S)-binding protein [Candidatus Tectomicrobia bacterium]|nr:(2Fe-2S)-binding protein [Candidatus Tectomicrobia bacterium]